jgi:membrane associated rhomboid family serine protease
MTTETSKKGASAGTIGLILVSIAAVAFGVLMLSDATSGVGLIALGIWFGVMARIAQAGNHYFGN